MGLLDRFEQSLERLLEGTTGSVFRQKLQPAEIGKKLERAMLDNQKPSVGSPIVPNAYTVHLHPQDFAQIQRYTSSLARQMESWLFQVASRHDVTVLDKISVTFIEDISAPSRRPVVEAAITDRSRPVRLQQQQQARWPNSVHATSVFQPIPRPSTMWQLRAVSGAAAGQTFAIPEGTSTIGRSPDNTVVINAPDVSRRHARLECSGNHLRIYDLNSTNGTRINGEAVHISDIEEGDELRLGSQVFDLVSLPGRAHEGRL